LAVGQYDTGAAQIEACGPSGGPQIGTGCLKLGAREVRFSELGAEELRPLELGVIEARPLQVGAFEVRILELGAEEFRPLKLGSFEVGPEISSKSVDEPLA
jgi:hypothetical protein